MTLTHKKFVLTKIIITSVLILSFFLSFLYFGLNFPEQYTYVSDTLDTSFNESLVKNTSDSEQPPINILFLGIVGEGSRGALLTDSIFILHLNPLLNKKISIISIPRDLWVQIPNRSSAMKINNLYELENRGKKFPESNSFNLIKQKIEEITGLPLNYVAVVDLEGFKKLVDILGGIDIWIEKDIIDPNLVNPHNPSEIFHLSAGWRHLDGDLTVKFIRTRYAPEGDFYRIEHQQQIIAAIKNKLTKLADVWNLITWLKIWQSLRGHYVTNLNFNTVWYIFTLIKNVPVSQIEYIKLTNRPPDELLISSSINTQNNSSEEQKIYILIPSQGFENYNKIHEYLKEKISFGGIR